MGIIAVFLGALLLAAVVVWLIATHDIDGPARVDEGTPRGRFAHIKSATPLERLLVVVGALIAGVVLLVWWAFKRDFADGGWWIFLVTAPVFLFGAWLMAQGSRYEQAVLAERKNFLAPYGATPTEAFFLYLRPSSDRHFFQLGLPELENLLTQALALVAKLLPISATADAIADEKRKLELTTLFEEAKWIVVTPCADRDVAAQLVLLKREGCLPKTLFLLPPTDASDWGQVEAVLEQAGIPAPEAMPEGGLFRIDPDTNRLLVRQLPRPHPVNWMKTFQSLTDEPASA